MSEPVYRQLVHDLGTAGVEIRGDAEKIGEWLTRHIHPHAYHQASTGNKTGNTGNTQENPVSLLDTALTKVDDLAAHLRTLAENEVAKLEADAARFAPIATSPIVQVIERYVLGADAEQQITDIVETLAGKWGTPKTDPTAPVDTSATADAQPAPAAPADPTAAQPAA